MSKLNTATHAQLVDYVYVNTDKNVLKKQLTKLSDDMLRNIIISWDDEKEFEKYVSRGKPVKFLVEVTNIKAHKDQTMEIADYPDEIVENLRKDGLLVTKIERAKGHHVCPYCHSIADGDLKDLLCYDCQRTFGHSLFRDL